MSAPQWTAAAAAYVAAKKADDDYAVEHFGHITNKNATPAIRALPPAVLDQAALLENAKSDAEDALMAIPSPHAAGFAMKYLVAKGDGRETDCWNAMLEDEAERFASRTDEGLERLWDERCRALAEYDADDAAMDDEAINRSYWDRIEAAEDAIVAHTSTTPRAAELRLWIALFHGSGSHVSRIAGPIASAIQQGETAPLTAAYDQLDFHEQAILVAILNLRGENL